MKKFSKKIIAVIVITAFVCGFAPLLDFDNIAFAAITEYTDGDFIFTLDNSLATIKSYGGNSETVQVPEKVSDGDHEIENIEDMESADEIMNAEKENFPEDEE